MASASPRARTLPAWGKKRHAGDVNIVTLYVYGEITRLGHEGGKYTTASGT